MAAYVVVEIHVEDAQQYERYKEMAGPTVTAHGGRYVVRGGAAEVLEGDREPGRVVVLEFPTVARAKEWWSSETYSRARGVRASCAATQMIVVEGV